MAQLSNYAKLRARLEQPPPPGYVAGIGRGASGFTTRSDIGPSTSGHGTVRDDAAPGAPAPPAAPKPPTDGDKGDYNDTHYDEFEGFTNSNLFKNQEWTDEDKAADKVYRMVDTHMDERRKRRREEREVEILKKHRKDNPKLNTQFADNKAALAQMSHDEWDSIPDVGNYSIKKKKQEIWTPVPDSHHLRNMNSEGHSNTLDAKQMQGSGMATPAGQADLLAAGHARGSVLDMSLKRASDSVSGQTVVDPKGIMTELQQQNVDSTDVANIKRAREVMKSVTLSDPTNSQGWIGRARVEQQAGKLAVARQIIAEGCEKAGHAEEIWVEAANLATPLNAKIVIAKAVAKIPNSVKLWAEAARYETEPAKKRIVFRKALEAVPNSVRLWKEAVEMEKPDDARIMLRRAVECVNNVDLWLALAKLETYQNAKKILNTASQQNRAEAVMWIAAAQLEESVGNKDSLDRIIRKAVKALTPSHCTREQWIKESEKSEKSGYAGVARAIIFNSIHFGLDDDEKTRKHTFVQDATTCAANKSFQTARAIYAYALQQYPKKKSLWFKAALLEKNHFGFQETDALLSEAVKACPEADYLWLMHAKEKWINGHIQDARDVLTRAFTHNEDSEQVWVAAATLEAENGHLDHASKILASAREKAASPRIWLKSAKLERQQNNRQPERKLLGEGVKKWPSDAKLWTMLLQWEEWKALREKNLTPAEVKKSRDTIKALYAAAIKGNPDSVLLWITASRLEEVVCKDVVKARSVLEKARSRLPRNEDLWVATIRLELRDKRTSMAMQNLSKALQECPASGKVWVEAISIEPEASRRAKGVQALRKCDKDALVISCVAKIFWAERKLDTARKWFHRAVSLRKDLGDAWALYYRFEVNHGTDEQRVTVLTACTKAAPTHGELWTTVSKSIENITMGGCKLSTEQILKEVAKNVEDVGA
eukprot:TRINITY_DN18578_c1_g1_i1.p1 TRINITY_DN18578_c1_g1~~TRINITY_DN18578_c1_g1_i1.p1  ORF type:complete len:939 (+),score=249.69 TRINITY_DN18578_c1_g1_i1:57-2873(+)